MRKKLSFLPKLRFQRLLCKPIRQRMRALLFSPQLWFNKSHNWANVKSQFPLYLRSLNREDQIKDRNSGRRALASLYLSQRRGLHCLSRKAWKRRIASIISAILAPAPSFSCPGIRIRTAHSRTIQIRQTRQRTCRTSEIAHHRTEAAPSACSPDPSDGPPARNWRPLDQNFGWFWS